jgi:beta-lactam-binding protein with PASTA domain
MKGAWIGGILAAGGLVLTLACCGVGSTKSAAPDGPVAVPDLVGDAMDTVRDQLQAVGLVGSATNGYGGTDWGSDAVVVGQKPVAGTRVARGATVKISEATKGELAFFSKPMPDLRGLMWSDSASGVTEAAYPYLVWSWREPRRGERPGSIVAQKPAPGKRVKLGTKINLTVANYEPVSPSGSYGSPDDWDPDINLPNACRRTRWC